MFWCKLFYFLKLTISSNFKFVFMLTISSLEEPTKNKKIYFAGIDSGRGRLGGLVPPKSFHVNQALSCILFYLRYIHSFLYYFSFISFFNYHGQIVILIVYLNLKGLVLLFAFINILLFRWVYFTSFFDHYIEQNTLLLIRSSHWGIFYKTAVLKRAIPIKICMRNCCRFTIGYRL